MKKEFVRVAGLLVLPVWIGCIATALPAVAQGTGRGFDVTEATISDLHAAMRSGKITCRAVVEQYLQRIAAYDKNGVAINSIVVTNLSALKEADELDRQFKAGTPMRPLHCVPTIVKDNFETIGIQSANGSLTFAGYLPEKDAFQVSRIKAAGAIVLAKSNMAEWAFTPYETVSSILPGYTKNPYGLDRVTAGSSGGTAAAVAASFGAVGLGSDTGNSIRGPSSHQALVGIRSTMGLTSRGGVFPLAYLADIAGPMTRTVTDAVKVFQEIVGEDPADPMTAAARGRPVPKYLSALSADGLKGARIGVLRPAYERDTTDPEIVAIFMRAVEDMRRAGAIIVDPAVVPGLDTIRRTPGVGPCRGFKFDLNAFLAERGDKVPVKTLAEIVKGGKFHPTVRRQLEQSDVGPANAPDSKECEADSEFRQQVRNAVDQLMDTQKLDALVYPTWSNPPRLIGDLNTPHGDNSQFFSPITGYPAVQVPMGYSLGDRLPAGITFFGRAWSEAVLFKLAYSFEQATQHRRAPPATPPMR